MRTPPLDEFIDTTGQRISAALQNTIFSAPKQIILTLEAKLIPGFGRLIVSSTQLAGPCIIRDLMAVNKGATTSLLHMFLLIGSDPRTDSGAESRDRAFPPGPTKNFGFIAQAQPFTTPLDIIIGPEYFYLKADFVNPQGAQQNGFAVITIEY